VHSQRSSGPEWALFISREEGLEQLKSSWKIEGKVPRFSRLYFGNEFCQKLIPSKEVVDRALAMAYEQGMAFSLLTPYVTDEGLNRLDELFSFLSKGYPKTEVIVNDWGAQHLLRRKHPCLKLSLGRVLNKLTRILPNLPYTHEPSDTEAASSAMRRPALSFPPYRRFLEKTEVQRVELDYPPQGLELERVDLPVSLYLPYGYLTTGRACMIGSLDLPKKEKFSSTAHCQYQCLNYFSELSSGTFSAAGQKLRLFQGGNTVFYRHSPEMVTKVVEMSQEIEEIRMVFQPQLPM